MRVLIGCEFSGTVRRAFAALGHDAWSCDLLPAEDASPNHYQGSIFDMISEHWDLGIFHPPCTYLANSGVCHLHKSIERWKDMHEGALFFKRLLQAPIARKAVENPIQHKYAQNIIDCKHSQVIQPWMFGHTEQKATCLWLDGLAPLVPTNNVKEEMLALPKRERERLHYLSPGPNRWKERSRTYQGIANAMAQQWGAAA